MRVRLQFLRAREARQRQLRLGQRQRALFRIADHVGDDAADQRRLLGLLLTNGGVPCDDVSHLVGKHRCKLGFVVGERNQAAGRVKLSGRQREGVDRLRIENRDLVVQIGPLRCRHQAFDRLLEQALQSRIVVDTAVGGEDALMLAQHRGRHVAGLGGLGRRRQRSLRLDRGRRSGAGGEHKCGEHKRKHGNAGVGKPKPPRSCKPPLGHRPVHQLTCNSLAMLL